MTMSNIVNLPDWEVIEAKESEYDYAIHAKYTPEPTACIRCGVIGQLYRHGIKRQRFMDLPGETRCFVQEADAFITVTRPNTGANATMSLSAGEAIWTRSSAC